MKALTCAAARRRLNAFYDRELPVDEQIAMTAHLDRCRECAGELDSFRLVGNVLRARASSQAGLFVEDAVGFRAGVVNRAKAERDSSFLARVRVMFEDMHLVYAGVGATGATIVCVIIMLGMMRFATNERPDSLAAMVAFLATPGSSASAASIDAESHARWTARLSAADETAESEAVFTLAAVLTRGGRIAKLEHLRADHKPSAAGSSGISDAKLIEGLLDEVSRARLGSAQADGLQPPSNLVWLITSTTVRASQSATVVDLPLPPAPKKRAAIPTATRPSLLSV